LREEPIEVESPPDVIAVAVPVDMPATVSAPAAEPPPVWGAGNTFQALLFRTAGLMLAVPLVELSGVQEFDPAAVTAMPGHQPWYLGLVSYREHSTPVIDTALLVLPEERLARIKQPPAERLTRIVFIDNGRWGLACDAVADVVTLTPDQVRWRTSRSKRRWLAGTVIEQMCAIIDPPAFARLLATGIEDAPEA
jgi:purine-binding chemotaxis protein CheW